jgi:hypothetical protein
LKYPNGTKVARAFIGAIDGTEHVLTTGFIKPGAKITISHLDGDKTLASAVNLMKEINAAQENDLLVFSCAARAWALGAKVFEEMAEISASAEKCGRGSPLRYNVAYTGGEICPVRDNSGNLVNMMHNYTLAVCAFN